MKVGTIALVACALVGGVALGWAVRPAEKAPAEGRPAPKKPERASKRVEDVGGDAARDALRRRVKELERELAALRAERAAPQDEAPSNNAERVETPRRHGPPSAADFRAHMEEMRKNNPEQYAQMTNRMANFRAFGLRRAANRLDTLASVDTSRMTKKELAVHEKLQDLIAREQELHDIARPDNESTTDEERQAAWKELRELWRQKNDLERAERNTLLAKAAESYGVKGAEAKELVETVKAVYEATQSGWGGGPHNRGGGRRGRR